MASTPTMKPNAWQEAASADGKVYYWNTESKETKWERPPEMPADLVIDVAWRAIDVPNGKRYYYNDVTNKSTWDLPQAYLKTQQNQPPPRSAAPAFVAGGHAPQPSFDAPQRDHGNDRGYGLPQRPPFDAPQDGGRPWERKQQQEGYRGPIAKLDAEPEYANFEESEAAFMKLLTKKGVQPDWSWEKTMRAVIRDPQYRSLKDSKDRKAAFEKYIVDIKVKERENAKERLTKLRQDFKQMLKAHDGIKHYTRWKTAKPMIESESVYKSTTNEDERRQMFDEYILEIKRKHVEEEAAARKYALGEVGNYLRVLNLDANTRWAEAQGVIMDNRMFAEDEKYRPLSKGDVLNAFEQHVSQLDRERNDIKQHEKRSKNRKDRQARDAFRALIEELKNDKTIGPGAKWKDVYPLMKDDPRFIATFDLPPDSSSAMDLFWDALEEEERMFRQKRNSCLDVLEDMRFELTLETPYEQFYKMMKDDPKTTSLSDKDLRITFDRLMEKIIRRAEDAKIKAEKHQRHAVDELRYVIKRLKPPVGLSSSWEEVRPQIKDTPEFRALEDEDSRHAAFEKHIKRLQEKDSERDRAHREARHESRRDRDRRHRTRTPEVDAYAEERRKAQADREKQYKRGSGGFALTPPPRERRERDDRYDRRGERQTSMTIYDRERRERERERTYTSRADPRDKSRALDYGDEGEVVSRPGSIRKRRDSEGSGRENNKRSRRHFSPVPVLEPKPEEPELQSGSEEGEIEEV